MNDIIKNPSHYCDGRKYEPRKVIRDKDTIYRQDAIDAIEDVDWYHQNRFTKEMVHGSSSEYESWYKVDDIYNAIDCVPSAQPEQRKGEWVIYVISMLDGEGCKCSECGFEGVPYWDFCPNCGADMRGDSK